ncbi:MAG: hypothetical protein ACR2M1_05240 [Gemmatimonadaceae bacterium]
MNSAFTDALARMATECAQRDAEVDMHAAAAQGVTVETFREERRLRIAAEQADQERAAAEVRAERDRAWDNYEQILQHAFPLPFRFDLVYVMRVDSLSASSQSANGTTRATVMHIRVLEPVDRDRIRRESGTILCGAGKRAFDLAGVNRNECNTAPRAGAFGSHVTCPRCSAIVLRWTNPVSRDTIKSNSTTSVPGQ